MPGLCHVHLWHHALGCFVAGLGLCEHGLRLATSKCGVPWPGFVDLRDDAARAAHASLGLHRHRALLVSQELRADGRCHADLWPDAPGGFTSRGGLRGFGCGFALEKLCMVRVDPLGVRIDALGVAAFHPGLYVHWLVVILAKPYVLRLPSLGLWPFKTGQHTVDPGLYQHRAILVLALLPATRVVALRLWHVAFGPLLACAGLGSN